MATTLVAATSPAEPAVVEHAPARSRWSTTRCVVALDRSLIDAAHSHCSSRWPVTRPTTTRTGRSPSTSAMHSRSPTVPHGSAICSTPTSGDRRFDPDLILMTAVRHEDLYDEFSAIAPTVATESAGGGWKDNIRLIAAATGRTELGEQVLADYEARAAEVGAAVNAAADDPTISVVRFADAIRLYQPVSFSGVVLEDAGLSRPESQQDRDDFIAIISEEELGLADADVLIYTIAAHDAVEKMAGEVQERPLWQSLSAVQTGNAHPVLDDSWMSGVGVFGARLILDDLETIFGVG
ncbi:MAG: iron-siderophore ABC transporter substrate-binding protein [Ilumatobacteraceae bacterium]